MDGMQNDLSQKIDNLQYSISRLTNLNTMQEKGVVKRLKLPTPKPHVEEEEEEETKKREEIKGKKKDISEGKEDYDSTVNANSKKVLIKEEMLKKHTSPPFPQALHGKKGIRNASEILKALRQVKVNIPLLDMIKQVPTYAKFLKDLCTIKRGLNVNKKAFLTEQEWTHAIHFWQHDLELNIFYMSKKLITPEEEESPKEVCIINTLVRSIVIRICKTKLNESLGDLEEGLPEPSDVLATLQGWKRRKEILPLFNKEKAQEAAKEETPKLI
ncbi:hypothetical protein CK203_115863 [Vitis vinifera]|uniref:Uncharacterized protein n=1 Tax=Vitis vinifera TaxID=29760 RepID=A0A438FDH0_VITVI|nr:hypothetical protein CK203_115863 [Vitis vinifera]